MKLLEELRNGLDCVDEQVQRATRRDGYVELLIMRSNNIKVKIYQEKGHLLPHVHVDYGKINHAASYSIDPPGCLEGNLKRDYDVFVIAWITMHKDSLLNLWKKLQAGDSIEPLLLELR
jgi:hypothetical protein